jgi:hypothetical protein
MVARFAAACLTRRASVSKKREQLVFDHGAASQSAKLIALKLGYAARRGEIERPSVQNVVAQKLRSQRMPLVGARLRQHVDLPAGGRRYSAL